MKKITFLFLACLLIGICEAQTPYLAKFSMESCLHWGFAEIEHINQESFPKDRIINQKFVGNTLMIDLFLMSSCSVEEAVYKLSGDTIQLGLQGNSYPIYKQDSLGNIVESGEDRNQIYCICFFKVSFEIKNLQPQKEYVIMRGKHRLQQKFEPTYKVLSKKKERTIETVSLRFSPADKGYLRPHERVNLYDEQGRRQGKHVSQSWVYDERLIVYFQDDLPVYRVKYKILPASPTEKADVKYFALNCHKFVETTYYANGRKQEEVFFDDKGESSFRTRWNEAGKPVFLGK